MLVPYTPTRAAPQKSGWSGAAWVNVAQLELYNKFPLAFSTASVEVSVEAAPDPLGKSNARLPVAATSPLTDACSLRAVEPAPTSLVIWTSTVSAKQYSESRPSGSLMLATTTPLPVLVASADTATETVLAFTSV